MNDFEQRLKRVPPGKIPPDWRAEILAAAGAVTPAPAPECQSWYTRVQRQLNALLWPHPKAWAGLAAAWAVILLLQFSNREPSAMSMAKSAPPSPAMQAELGAQAKMLAELLGPNEPREAERSKPSASPHSQRRHWSAI